MINFSSIYERIKARLAFCFPVSHTSFSTNNTPEEEGMAMFVNKSDDKYLAISDGQGGQIEFRHSPIPPPSIISEIGVRAIIDGVIQSKYEFASYEWVNEGGDVDEKKWDMVIIGNGLYLRTAADSGPVQVGFKLVRIGQYVQYMNVPSKLQVGGSSAPDAVLQVSNAATSSLGLIVYGGDQSSGTTIAEFKGYDGSTVVSIKGNGNVAGSAAIASDDFITKSQLDGKRSTTIADITTADATDPASTQTLANTNKAKINELLAAFRTAGLITP